jgi:transcriptional regulator with XRE-family HTH domain
MFWKGSDNMKVPIYSRIQDAMNLRNMKAVDICEKTKIPKSSMSMYLSGRVEPKSDRLYKIAKCLDVSESWLLGYDVPMERTQKQKNNDAISDIVVKLRSDEEFLSIVDKISKMDSEKRKSLNAFLD